MMNFTMIKNCFDWGFYQKPDDIRIYVQAGNITSNEFKQITGVDYEIKQPNTDPQQNNQNVQNNQGTTNQNTAQ